VTGSKDRVRLKVKSEVPMTNVALELDQVHGNLLALGGLLVASSRRDQHVLLVLGRPIGSISSSCPKSLSSTKFGPTDGVVQWVAAVVEGVHALIGNSLWRVGKSLRVKSGRSFSVCRRQRHEITARSHPYSRR
jgi:hypothetical protein